MHARPPPCQNPPTAGSPAVFTVVQRFRSDLGLYNPLHCLVTDGAYEEQGNELRFLAAPPPTPERMTAVLAEVHEADDLDPRWPPACSSRSPARA
jgi:hypothetical protein